MSDELQRALQDPGYTPPRRAFGDVAALLSNPDLGDKAERALLSAGLPAAAYAAERLLESEPAEDPALLRVVGRALRSHDSPELLNALVRSLSSDRSETRRHAAMVLGKTGRTEGEAALVECLSTSDPKLLRSAVEALGKIGGERALAALVALQPPEAIRPVLQRARLMLERSLDRNAAGPCEIALDAPLPGPRTVVLHCRSGLSELLVDEAAAFKAAAAGSDAARFSYSGTLRPLLLLRTALDVSIEWPLPPGGDRVARVISALQAPDLVQTLRAWTNGAPRFRLMWDGQGHRRADTWQVAEALQHAGSPLKNDPTQAPWVVRVLGDSVASLLMSPVGRPELRFEYRKRDVPAASHPTLAAALARLAGVRADDVVWDPFTGSALELIERARLGPYRELHGTDLEQRALAAARENVETAGVERIALQQADARFHRVPGLTLALTNPPMGRRVLRTSGLSGLLCQVVRNVASQLAPGGRMVWLSPFADATARAAADAGLSVERLGPVDLGGFSAELQRFVASQRS